MRALLIFLVFVLSASAQTFFDPYQFIRKKDLHDADVNQFWRTLGISGKIRETTANGSKNYSENFDCGLDDSCEAKLFVPEWGLVDGAYNDTLVRITSPRYVSRFLVFHQEELSGSWRFVDYLDSRESRYAPAEPSVVNSGGKRWLVVNSQPRCGTGCSLAPSDWYELKNGKLRMVLSVPLSGHESNQNPGRYFETRFVRASQLEGRETLEFIYHVEFAPEFGSTVDGVLWGDEKIIRFSRPSGQGEFKFDAKNSEASRSFIDDIFSTDESVTEPRLLHLVQDHLIEIARGPNDQRRAWLKELLEKNPNLPELANVRAAFTKAR